MSTRREFLRAGAAAAPLAAVAASSELLAPAEAVADVKAPVPEPVEDGWDMPTLRQPAVLPGLARQVSGNDRPTIVSACVSSRLLSKADRLFSGDVTGRITEVIQNARRAGATKITISCKEVEDTDQFRIVVEDNGEGLRDFSQLLRLGHSGWDDEIEASEDPAGAGFFSLAPREVLVCSQGRKMQMTKESWLGAPTPVVHSDYTGRGVRLEFLDDEAWPETVCRECATYGGMDLLFNRSRYKAKPFVDAKVATHFPELGVRVQLVPAGASQQSTDAHYSPSLYTGDTHLNFYGQIVRSYGLRPLALEQTQLLTLVDMTGEPTGLRLQLPDRRSIIENEAWSQLKEAIRRMGLLSIMTEPSHNLPYSEWEYAQSIGIMLPEASPQFVMPVGDWTSQQSDGLALYCHNGRKVFVSDEVKESEARTLDMMGAYCDSCNLSPVSVNPVYAGYSWAQGLPVVKGVCVTSEPVPQPPYRTFNTSTGVNTEGELTVVEKISVVTTVVTSTPGRDDVVESTEIHPPLAMLDEYSVMITRESLQSEAYDSEFFFLTGGYSDSDADYDSQRAEVQDEIDRFRCSLLGDTEYARRKLVAAVKDFMKAVSGPGDKRPLTVTIDAAGCVSFVNSLSRPTRWFNPADR